MQAAAAEWLRYHTNTWIELGKVRFAIIFGVVFTLILVVGHTYGVLRNYTPIPYWDTWASYSIAVESLENPLQYLFNKHNGVHLIFTYRFVEFLDWHLLSGRQVLTTTMLAILPLAISLVFLQAVNFKKNAKIIVFCVISPISFCWTQRENFVWPFQAVMFYVILFAAIGFWCIQRFYSTGRPSFLVGASIFSMLSAFSMGNGVFCILLVPFYYAYLEGQITKKLLSVLVMTSILVVLWFLLYRPYTGYPGVGGGSLIAYAKKGFYIQDYLSLLGSTVHLIETEITKTVAALLGLVILLINIVNIFLIFQRRMENFAFPLLAFLLLSAAAVIFMRVVDYPTSWQVGRYQTLVLAIVSVTVINAVNVFPRLLSGRWFVVALVLVVYPCISYSKNQILYDNDFFRLEKAIQLTSVLVGADDPRMIHVLALNGQEIRSFTIAARKRNLGVFGHALFRPLDIFKASALPEVDSAFIVKETAFEEIAENFLKLHSIITCPPVSKNVTRMDLFADGKAYRLMVGKDKKNFGDLCRVGGYFPKTFDLRNAVLFTEHAKMSVPKAWIDNLGIVYSHHTPGKAGGL